MSDPLLPTSDVDTLALFAQARVSDYWIEYPFMENGDPFARIYHMRCSVASSGYSALTIGTQMATAGAAGVISLPWINSTAFFVGDFNHRYLDGGLVEFDRQFATVPTERTREVVGSRSFPFLGVRDVVYNPPATAEQGNQGGDVLWKWRERASGNNNPAPLYLTSKYLRLTNFGSIDGTEVFAPTLDGIKVDFISDGGSGSFANGVALNGESFTASYAVSPTSPTLSEWETKKTNAEFLVVDFSVERYKGDILVTKTYEMLAQ